MFVATGEMLGEVGGFRLNFEHLNLERIMRQADVSRSAVYRVWRSREEFNLGLLKALASAGTGGVQPFDSQTQTIAAGVVEERPQLLDTVEGHRTLLLEAIRRAAAASFTITLTERSWRRFAVLTVSADSMNSVDDPGGPGTRPGNPDDDAGDRASLPCQRHHHLPGHVQAAAPAPEAPLSPRTPPRRSSPTPPSPCSTVSRCSTP